jgi:hypothetical protein
VLVPKKGQKLILLDRSWGDLGWHGRQGRRSRYGGCSRCNRQDILPKGLGLWGNQRQGGQKTSWDNRRQWGAWAQENRQHRSTRHDDVAFIGGDGRRYRQPRRTPADGGGGGADGGTGNGYRQGSLNNFSGQSPKNSSGGTRQPGSGNGDRRASDQS